MQYICNPNLARPFFSAAEAGPLRRQAESPDDLRRRRSRLLSGSLQPLPGAWHANGMPPLAYWVRSRDAILAFSRPSRARDLASIPRRRLILGGRGTPVAVTGLLSWPVTCITHLFIVPFTSPLDIRRGEDRVLAAASPRSRTPRPTLPKLDIMECRPQNLGPHFAVW